MKDRDPSPRRGASSRPQPDSRERILVAGAEDFAANGYVGARVDRIAAAARVNKAMIYYHFASKAGLYRAILADLFLAVSDRVARLAAVRQSALQKLDAYVACLAHELAARPHLSPIMLREVIEGGRHVDADTAAIAQRIRDTLADILADGVRTGEFKAVNPLAVHVAVIAPLLFVHASKAARARMISDRERGALSPETVTEHVTMAVRASVVRQPPVRRRSPR